MQYNTALYLRLSKEDRKNKESDSIANQRLLLHSFMAHQPDLVFYKEYIDDGVTGINFNRPGFTQMMADLDNRMINCIICKDCARFGRDYIECGSYVREFDDYNVRFIAVNDNYDSGDPNRDDTIFAIKNVMNTEYSRGKSRDIRRIFKEKQYSGEYMGAFSVYGYKKDESDKHRFIIDTYAAHVVRRVFQMFCDGTAKQTIARRLTEEGILSPAEYKSANGSNFHTGRISRQKSWSYGAIHSMLQNEVYLGNTVQNKTYRKRMKGKAYKNPPEKWIIVENTHQPIISTELWNKAQRLLEERAKPKPHFSTVCVTAGFIKCADCGANLSAGSGGNTPTLICGTYKRMGKTGCKAHIVPKQLIPDIILEDLNKRISFSDNLEKKIASYQLSAPGCTVDSESALNKLELKLLNIRFYKKKAFEAYQETLITLKDFENLQAQYEEEENTLLMLKKNIRKQMQTGAENVLNIPWLDNLHKKKKLTELDRSTIADVVEAIYVSENKEIRIVYRYSDEPVSFLHN